MAKVQLASGSDIGVMAEVTSDGLLKILIDQANSVIPVNMTYHETQTIQTHSGVTIGPSGNSYGNYASSWIDADGFDKVAFIAKNDGSTAFNLEIIWSHDNVNMQGDEKPALVTSGNSSMQQGVTDIKARYFKFYIANGDAAPHTMSAWAYLKA